MQIRCRALDDPDVEVIRAWPPYQPPFEDLDYALRAGGWLDRQGTLPGSRRYVFEADAGIVAFSLLVREQETEPSAEFYVAVRGDQVGGGIGQAVTRETVRRGFLDSDLQRIWLKVRTNHAIGRHIYEKVGFRVTGEKRELVNGRLVEFVVMEITPEVWRSREGASP